MISNTRISDLFTPEEIQDLLQKGILKDCSKCIFSKCKENRMHRDKPLYYDVFDIDDYCHASNMELHDLYMDNSEDYATALGIDRTIIENEIHLKKCIVGLYNKSQEYQRGLLPPLMYKLYTDAVYKRMEQYSRTLYDLTKNDKYLKFIPNNKG